MSYSIKFPMRKKYRFLSLTGAVIHLPHARTSTHQERDLPPPPIDPASWCPPPSPARSPLTAALHPPPAACSLLRPQRSPAAAIDVPSELSPAPRRRAPPAAGLHHLLLPLPTPAAVSQPAPTPARANAHAKPRVLSRNPGGDRSDRAQARRARGWPGRGELQQTPDRAFGVGR